MTVLEGASTRKTVWTGGGWYEATKSSFIFIDLTVKLKNLKPSQNQPFSYYDMFLSDAGKNLYSPYRYGSVAIAGEEKIDPSTISLTFDDPVKENDIYVRLIYIVVKEYITQPLTFHFRDMPGIPFTVTSE